MNNPKLVVGVYLADTIPQSFRVYAQNVLKFLPGFGIEPVVFKDSGDLPRRAEVLWDIRSGGGNPPLEFMMGHVPLVVTVHGFAPLSLSGWEYFKTLRGWWSSRGLRKKRMAQWRHLKNGVSALIAVSEFGKKEALVYTGIPGEKIYVCRHGVDTENFFPSSENPHARPYLLHISNNEPRKNVDRIVDAFSRLRREHPIELLLKLPGDQANKYRHAAGVKIIERLLTDAEIADLYRHAAGYVFPSLYEGFGLPILEAMACGCPVITADTTACAEVAGGAAITVDPRNGDALYEAMSNLCANAEFRQSLKSSGYQRVKDFGWEKSAHCHAQVFRRVAGRL